MTLRRPLVLLCLAAVVWTVFGIVWQPRADEVDESDLPPVSETEIDMYIKVYGAMLADHDLNIENAIQPHHLTIEAFRQVERRIQSQPRLVERVRDALIEQAKARSAFAQTLATPGAAEATPAAAGRKKPTPK
jgi:hypothetical protein